MSKFNIFNFKKLIILVIIYAVLFIAYGYYSYSLQKEDAHKKIHQELLHGALSVPLLLDKNYHDIDFSKHRPSKAQDLQNIKKLSKFIQHTNLAYIYSFIQTKDGRILFSASSATQKELDQNKSDLYSFDEYKDKNLSYLFKHGKTGEKIYTYTTDKWGDFLSVYILLKTDKGNKYIVGADYKQQDLIGLKHTILKNIFYITSFIIILIILISLFSNYSIVKILKKELQKKTKELKLAYEIDQNTNIPNKQKLFYDLQNMLDSTNITIIDIEKFSMINDVYGYEYGNNYLIYITSLLNKQLLTTKDYKLYKLESDIFCVLSNKKEDALIFKQNIHRILTNISKEKFISNEYESGISVRAGVADISRKDNPLMHAELALKYAKENRLKTAIYSTDMDTNLKNKEILDNINYAIENKKVFAYFQPIYEVKTGTINKYESLMRIETKDGKIVPPAYFLDLAKKTILYNELTKIMLEQIIKAAKNHPSYNFSMNLSSIDVENTTLTNYILETIENANIANQITFEILESEEFKDFDTLFNFVNRVKESNIKISIDDFGSGYSNIDNTIKLNIDYLKIDGSLISHILTNPTYEKLLVNIVKFSKDIQALTIAEYVATPEIAQKMRELNIDMIQGYYIGKPSPVICEETPKD